MGRPHIGLSAFSEWEPAGEMEKNVVTGQGLIV